MKMVFDEWYGELSFAQRAAYRKHNIPPALHDELVEAFGNDHAAITKFVNETAARNGTVGYGDVWREVS